MKRPAGMQAAYTWLIADALDAAGIEIPFPQTDIRLRSVFGQEGEAAMEALGWTKPAGARAAAKPLTAHERTTVPIATNDAAQEILSPETDPTGPENEAAE